MRERVRRQACATLTRRVTSTCARPCLKHVSPRRSLPVVVETERLHTQNMEQQQAIAEERTQRLLQEESVRAALEAQNDQDAAAKQAQATLAAEQQRQLQEATAFGQN